MTSNTDNTFRETMKGSAYVFLGQLLFATNDAIIKLSGMKISQLMIGRFTVCLLIAITWWLIKKPSTVNNWYGDQPHIANIWIRGMAYSITIICLWYGIIRLPLGDAYCIFNQSPILIAIIAAIFLKEKLPKLTPIIALFGITGILFLSQPTWLTSDDNSSLNVDGLTSMFIAVISWSISVVLVRTAKESHFLQLEIVSAGQTLFIALPILLLFNEYFLNNTKIGGFNANDWEWDFKSIGIMIVIGFNGFAALCLNVVGFQYGDATKVGWLEYIAIVFTFMYQIFLFGDIPDIFEIIGVILVIIACAMSVLEEVYHHYYEHDEVSSDEDYQIIPGPVDVEDP